MLADEVIVLGAHARVVSLAIPGLAVEADRGMPTKDPILPLCEIFVGNDEAKPDGDARTGVTGFVHRIAMAIEITAKGNTERGAKAWLAAAGETILDGLFRDVDWATRDGRPIIEGFGGMRRAYVAPPEGNHTTVKYQIEIEVLLRSEFSPSTAWLPDFATLSAGLVTGPGDPVIGTTILVPTE